MTRDEALSVLAVLTAAWPNATITEPTLRVWADALAELDARDALEAARQIVRVDQWFPTIARFVETTKAAARRRVMDERDRRRALESGEPRPSPEVAEAGIAAARDALRSARSGR